MAEYQDLGQYVMKLFDDLIADSKQKITEARDTFIRDLPSKISSRTTVSSMMVEGIARDLSNILLRINQDCLNDYSISIAKKARSATKKKSKTIETEFVANKELLEKKQEEMEGVQAQIRALEKRDKILEQEKEETLKQFSEMSSRIQELEGILNTTNTEFENQIALLNADWETKFRQNQEEWDSYVKLKLAEKEVKASTETTPTETTPAETTPAETIDSEVIPESNEDDTKNTD